MILLAAGSPLRKCGTVSKRVFRTKASCIILDHRIAGERRGQKIIVSEGVKTEVQVFYTGLYNFLTALVVSVFEWNFGLNFWLIVIASINAFAFYGAIAFTDMALKRMDVVKFAPSSYVQSLFVFVFGLILFGESVYISDLIGSFLIVAFHVYNAYDPIK